MIVYRPELSLGKEAFISLRKSEEFINRIDTAEIFHPPLLSDVDLALAHDPEHVRLVLSGRTPNGFGNRNPRILQQVRAANSCFSWAVENALLSRSAVCAPVSGFHHAGYDYCGGFCTFNGLLIAERRARRDGLLKKEDRVLIYDGDAHYGDGCVDIIDRLDLGKQVRYVGRQHGIPDREALDHLRKVLVDEPYALVLYQAGMDAYVNDSMGAGYLTKAELEERDRIVFGHCRNASVPLAWCFAGGYVDGVTVDLHLQSWRIFRAIYGL